MSTIRFTDKESFIAALESRRSFWRAYDTRMARDHQVAEKTWLADARRTLREALKMDYDALKEAADYGRLSLGGSVPKCPVLQEPKLDRVLTVLGFTQGKTFTVDSKGNWDLAHWLLTHDPDARTTVC